MLTADYKLIPVRSAEYIAKNKPERYMKGVPIYVVGTNQKKEKVNYDRAYTQVMKLFDAIVKSRAKRKTAKQPWRQNKFLNVREK